MVDYAPENTYIKRCFSKEKDNNGHEIVRPMGHQLVFYADGDTGALADGPWIEPVPTTSFNSDYQFEGEGTPVNRGLNILGFEIFDNDSQSGGLLGHWRHPACL